MARWMFSRGMFSERAFCTASRRRKFDSGSPPPSRAETVISRVSLVKSWPRRASAAPFFRLIVAHLLCPDMWHLFSNDTHGGLRVLGHYTRGSGPLPKARGFQR